MARGSRAKRGFTITELVVVIGIIAILAAVLIPTFANIIQRSRESADTQNVEHMNTALYAYEVSNEKPSTMTDVVEVLADSGYLLENLSPTGDGYDIVWDQEHNRLALIDEDGETIYSDGDVSETASMLWTIVDEIPTGEEDKGYSYYLSTGYVGADAVTVTAGVDVGENEGIAVTYATQEAKNVTVRTNGGALTVNAPASNVNHYGTASEVTITAVAQNSYHLYGRVESDITVTSGRVVLESGSSSNTVYVNGGGVRLEWSNNAKPEAVGVSSSVNLNEVSIPEDDEVEVTGSINETYRGLFAGGLGTESSPYLIATAEQFANIGTLSDEMGEGTPYHFVLNADIDLRTVTFSGAAVGEYFSGSIDGNGHSLIVNDSLSYLFMDAGGSAAFSNIDYQLISKGVMLCPGMTTERSVDLVFDNVDISTVTDGEVIVIGQNEGLYVAFSGYSYTSDGWGAAHRNSLTLRNCDVDVDLSATSYNAVFIGGALYNTDAAVESCTYSGNYYGELVNLVLGNAANYVDSLLTVQNVVNNGGLYGTERLPMIAGGARSTYSAEPAYSFVTIRNCDTGTVRELNDATLAIGTDDDGAIEVTEATQDTSFYVLTFVGGTRRTSSTTENSSYRFSIRLDAAFVDGVFATGYRDGKIATVEQYREFVDETASFDDGDAIELYGEPGAKLWIVENNGTVYYVFDFEDDYYHFIDGDDVPAAVDINQVLITAYDESELPIAQKSITLR